MLFAFFSFIFINLSYQSGRQNEEEKNKTESTCGIVFVFGNFQILIQSEKLSGQWLLEFPINIYIFLMLKND